MTQTALVPVRMLTPLSGAHGTCAAGEIIALPSAAARAYLRAGLAEAVDVAPGVESAMRGGAPETATRPAARRRG